MDRPRRAPAVERFISEIKKEDIRVKVFGTVEGAGSSFLILKDDTGKIRVSTNEIFADNKKIRVFGRPVYTNNGLELESEIIQNMDLLNEKLYKKAHTLLEKEVSQ